MLWSLIKILFFVALIAALTLGAGYLMETGAGIRIALAGTEYNLGPVQAVIGALVLMLGLWLVLKLAGLLVAVVRFINGDNTALSRHFDRSRERKGLQALSDALMALASGEGQQALAKARRADKYLDRPQLTHLVIAQAAEQTGDRQLAEETYKTLLTHDGTRFVGIRGILQQKLAAGETDTALKLAEKAFALKPKHAETQDTLLKLQAEKHDWTGARRTLAAKLKHGALPRDVHRRRDAVLALSEAKDVLAEGNSIEAREAAIEANRLSPDLIPASVLAAEGYIRDGKPRYATRVLKKTWEAQPHPDLAAAFAAIEPDESPQARLKRFNTLTRLRGDHPETRMLQAELLIAAEDFPAARRALGDLVETDPTARVLTIMAAIERGEGSDDAVVRGWLTRALTASRGPQWVCDNCANIESHWQPVCSNCHSFDTLAWKEPTHAELAMPTGTAMLPLIVGRKDTGPAADLTVVDDAALSDGDTVDVAASPESTDPDAPRAEAAPDLTGTPPVAPGESPVNGAAPKTPA